MIDAKVWSGCHGIAGEWGHNYLDDSGGPCYCGKTGCVETIISGPALQRFYASVTGNTITLKEIVLRHQKHNDEVATQTIDRLCRFFGKAISVVTNLLDPDVLSWAFSGEPEPEVLHGLFELRTIVEPARLASVDASIVFLALRALNHSDL